MAPQPHKPRWSEIKTHLQSFDRSGLLALIADLYRSSDDNRRMLHAKLLGPATEIEEYRRRIANAIFPDPFSKRPISIGKAKRLIREYQLATGDTAGTVDLMLTMVEEGTKQASDLGYGDDAYFAALETTLDAVVKLIRVLPARARQAATERIVRVSERAADIGRGYGDYVRDVAASNAAPKRDG